MATTDFFGFDPTQEDEEGLLPVNAKGTDDEAYDVLNDETFGCGEGGDWEGEHETLLEKTQEDISGSSLLRSIGIPNGNSSTNFSPNSSFGAFENSPGTSLLDPVSFSESPGNSIWTEPSLIEKMTKSFNTPPREAATSANIYNLLMQPSLSANPQQMDVLMRRNQQSYRPPPQQQQQPVFGGVEQHNSVHSLMQQMNQQHNPLDLMLNSTGGTDSSRPPNAGLPFGHGKIKSVTDLENELRLQQIHKLNQVKTDYKQEKLGVPAAKQLQPFFTEEQEAQQIEKDQLVDIEHKKPPQQQQQQLSHHNQQHRHHNQQHHANQQHLLHQQHSTSRLHHATRPPPPTAYHNNPIHPLTRLPINPPQPQDAASQAMLLRLSQQQHFQQRHLLNSSANQRWPQQQQQANQQHQLNQAYRNFPAGVRASDGPAANGRGKERSFERRRNDSFSEGGSSEWEEWERARADDDYAGLMTPKQRAWLRNIQLMQLTTQDPYKDDYYCVMFRAKARRKSHPHEPLRIEGLERLLPQPAGGDRAPSYTPPSMENSLGKLQVASVNAPRKMMDVTPAPARPVPSGKNRYRHTLLLLERLYASLMKLEDLDRKISLMFDSPSRDSFIAAARQLVDGMWRSVSGDRDQMLALLKVAKGKSLFTNLMHRLPYPMALDGFRFVLDNLRQLSVSSESGNHNTLDRIWPVADRILANADTDTLIDHATRLMPYLETPADSKTCKLPLLLSTKFGVTVLLALLVKGEQDHERLSSSAAWQGLLSRAIQALAALPVPKASGEARDEAKVTVLGRGQSLSSVLRPVKEEGGLSAPLPLIVVSGGRECAPAQHLARCSDHVHSASLAAAQAALSRLEITPKAPPRPLLP